MDMAQTIKQCDEHMASMASMMQKMGGSSMMPSAGAAAAR